MGVCKKYRGSFEKCIRQYVKDRLDGRADIAPDLAFITHPVPKNVVRCGEGGSGTVWIVR